MVSVESMRELVGHVLQMLRDQSCGISPDSPSSLASPCWGGETAPSGCVSLFFFLPSVEQKAFVRGGEGRGTRPAPPRRVPYLCQRFQLHYYVLQPTPPTPHTHTRGELSARRCASVDTEAEKSGLDPRCGGATRHHRDAAARRGAVVRTSSPDQQLHACSSCMFFMHALQLRNCAKTLF